MKQLWQHCGIFAARLPHCFSSVKAALWFKRKAIKSNLCPIRKQAENVTKSLVGVF